MATFGFRRHISMSRPSVPIPLLLSIGALFLSLSPGAVTAGDPADELKLEARVLKKLARIAKRTGNSLSLSLDVKGSADFQTVDTCAGPEDCKIYRLVGLSPDRRFFVVRLSLWEGTNVYWVSRSTGMKYEVYAEPHVSPDGKNIVTAISSEAYDINGVFLWTIRDGGLTKTFHFEPSEYALYSFVGWLNPDTVKLKKFTHADKATCPGKQFMEVPVTLVRDGAHWKLDERLDPSTATCE